MGVHAMAQVFLGLMVPVLLSYAAPTTIIPGMESKFSLLMKNGAGEDDDATLGNLAYMYSVGNKVVGLHMCKDTVILKLSQAMSHLY